MNKFRFDNRASTALLIAATGLASTSLVTAQEGSIDVKTNVLIEEVVVTARKRDESAQDTPLAISAFSGESLEARGVINISEIDKISPNINYQNNPGSSGAASVATVYIRGVGQRDFLGTIDNGVGFYIDDVLIARTIGATVDLLEIERVEVLRGPQGTLFGRNNVGGAIKIHTKGPSNEFGGHLQGVAGTDSLTSLRVSADVPVSHNFLTKFSALYTSQDGYVDMPATGQDLGNENNLSLRAAFHWMASDSLAIDFSADYTTEDEEGPAFLLLESGVLSPGSFAGFHNNVVEPETCAYPGGIASTDPLCYNNQWVSSEVNFGAQRTFSDIDVWGASLRVSWQLSDNITFKSITAYRELDSEFGRDNDSSPLVVNTLYDSFKAEQFSQEFQLLGTAFDAKLDWMLGAYYFDEEGENVNLLNFTIADFISGSNFGTESQAIFAQGTYALTDKLDLTLGARYTEEDKTYDPEQTVGPNLIGIPYPSPTGDACLLQDEGANLANGAPGLVIPLPPTICPIAIVPFGEEKLSTDETTVTVNLAYRFTEGLMGYASYSDGFRSGGFVQRIFPPLDFVPSFEPEYVDSYELGFKYSNADGDFTLNGAVFFMDYTDIQVRTENPGFVGRFEANVGDAEISGFELEAKWVPVETWFLEAAVGYTDAKYTAIRVDPPLVAEVTLESEFDHVPEWNVSASVMKQVDLQDMGSLSFRLLGTYQSGYFNNPTNTDIIATPSTDLWDANMAWLSTDERTTVTLGIRNITDDEYLIAGFNNLSVGFANAIFDRGRQWFLDVKYDF